MNRDRKDRRDGIEMSFASLPSLMSLFESFVCRTDLQARP